VVGRRGELGGSELTLEVVARCVGTRERDGDEEAVERERER